MSELDVRNIHKNYGKTEVLKGISFSMNRGEVLAIIGSSGSGKTTLLRSLNFLERPERGTISVRGELLFDGEDKKSCSEKEIRTKRLHFGLVFQNFNLFPQYNVLQNVVLPMQLHGAVKKRDKEAMARLEEKAHNLIAAVGLSEKESSYPCQLSGGQQQRVAIARALALEPDILCFDEPTSALDPELTGEVLKVIRKLKEEGRTMIVVTHEMEFARHVADRVIFMSGGVIAEIGTAEEVFESPKNPALRSFLSKSKETY